MSRISKEFPGVKAVDGVDLELRSGEVTALVGENGAGKSTLVKMMAGIHAPTSGTILIDGVPVVIGSPMESKRLGIRVVHQEPHVVKHMSVAENMFLERLPSNKMGVVNFKALFREAQDLVNGLGIDLDCRNRAGELSVGQKEMLDIAKAVSFDAKVIVMDEPTSALSRKEIGNLFEIIRLLRKRGIAILYISHKLDEVFALSDHIVILRDGRRVHASPTSDLNEEKVIEFMVGRPMGKSYPRSRRELGETALEVEEIRLKGSGSPSSFTVRSGEIVGFAGLVGAGRTELMRGIFGADPISEGRVLLEGKEVAIRTPHDAIKAGLTLIPEDRKSEGLILQMDTVRNISIINLTAVMKRSCISLAIEVENALKYIKELSIKCASPRQLVLHLSGGNQQKVVLAKCLFAHAKVIIFDEGTRGIDVGAKMEVYQLMDSLAASGVAIVMVSSEIEELIGMCDRILVMREGRIAGEIQRQQFSPEKIMEYAIGGMSVVV